MNESKHYMFFTLTQNLNCMCVEKKHCPNYSNEEDGANGQVSKCETCGNVIDEQNIKLKKEKRFCSSMCAKR